MGFFKFFSKEKKETLDSGLNKTKEGIFSKLKKAVAGKSTIDDEVLDNLEEVAWRTISTLAPASSTTCCVTR